MTLYRIPDIRQILRRAEIWSTTEGKAGEQTFVFDSKNNATIPSDKNLLKKLGLCREDKIISVATFYGSWALAIAKSGAIVDYSDVSAPLTDYAKKNLKLFRKYICSNYIYLPKGKLQYDWTFTFEALGGRHGLPLAYLRSLLNKKGGILVSFPRFDKSGKPVGGKEKMYPLIVRTLAKVYGADAKVKTIFVDATRKDKTVLSKHKISIITTNDHSRSLAEKDVTSLFSGKLSTDSAKRLNKLTSIMDPEYIKEVEL